MASDFCLSGSDAATSQRTALADLDLPSDMDARRQCGASTETTPPLDDDLLIQPASRAYATGSSQIASGPDVYVTQQSDINTNDGTGRDNIEQLVTRQTDLCDQLVARIIDGPLV